VEGEHQLIESPEQATRIEVHGSPTIPVDDRDPFAAGAEQVGMMCRSTRPTSVVNGLPPSLS
jgi:hypothetical protein